MPQWNSLPTYTCCKFPFIHCKMRSMKFIQNYHNEHTKIEFGMLIVVILYEFHTSDFAVLDQCYLIHIAS